MQKILLVVTMLGALTAPTQQTAEHPSHVAYTRQQRQAAGFWRVMEPPQGANVAWLVIGLGDSRDTMTVRWPTSLGCQTEGAEMHAGAIRFVGGHFPVVIYIHDSKTATLSMFDGQTILHMKKTKEATGFLCE